MFKINSTDFIEKISSLIESRDSQKHFDDTTLEFVNLYFAHFSLLDILENVYSHIEYDYMMQEILKIKETIEKNIEILLKIIEKSSKRKIIKYDIKSGDSVWEIVKNFKSDAAEIYRLNGLSKAFSLEDKKVLLIPIKN